MTRGAPRLASKLLLAATLPDGRGETGSHSVCGGVVSGAASASTLSGEGACVGGLSLDLGCGWLMRLQALSPRFLCYFLDSHSQHLENILLVGVTQ